MEKSEEENKEPMVIRSMLEFDKLELKFAETQVDVTDVSNNLSQFMNNLE